MSRTEEQREVEKLLGSLETAIVSGHTFTPEQTLVVIKVCRLQQDQLEHLQDIPRNIGLGLKIVGLIGSVAFAIISAVGGILAIRGYFKG